MKSAARRLALGGGRRADGVIAAGGLGRPIAGTLRSDSGYYGLVPRESPLSGPAQLFRDWVLAEARGSPE